MNTARCAFAALAAIIGVTATSVGVRAQDKMGGPATGPTAQLFIDWERRWAQTECTHESVLSEILADDFRGTAPNGSRYDKAQAIARAKSDTSKARDCRMFGADVYFFSATIAIVYGSETAVMISAGEGEKRRCLVWTDTWVNRQGKWQIIGVQDANLECPKE